MNGIKNKRNVTIVLIVLFSLSAIASTLFTLKELNDDQSVVDAAPTEVPIEQAKVSIKKRENCIRQYLLPEFPNFHMNYDECYFIESELNYFKDYYVGVEDTSLILSDENSNKLFIYFDVSVGWDCGGPLYCLDEEVTKVSDSIIRKEKDFDMNESIIWNQDEIFSALDIRSEEIDQTYEGGQLFALVSQEDLDRAEDVVAGAKYCTSDCKIPLIVESKYNYKDIHFFYDNDSNVTAVVRIFTVGNNLSTEFYEYADEVVRSMNFSNQ